MRNLLILLALTAFGAPAAAVEMKSEYTDIDFEKTCSTFSSNEEGGDFANLACPG